MSKRAIQTVWKERIQECKSSGMKVTEWCKMNEISRPAYYYWHRRLKDNDPEIPLQSFVKVPAETISVNKTTSTPELVVSWKGFTIKISDEESLPLAAELISMIGGQSC